MKRKKFMSCMMAAMTAAMMITVPMTASAADNTNMEVKYELGSTYTMSIPSSISLGVDAEATTQAVGFAAYNIAHNKQLKLTVKQKIGSAEATDITNGEVTLTETNNSSLTAKTVLQKDSSAVSSSEPLLTLGTGILPGSDTPSVSLQVTPSQIQ